MIFDKIKNGVKVGLYYINICRFSNFQNFDNKSFLMRLYSSRFRNLLNKWPGEKYFGVYRFLPLFFILGAALEFSMINWRVGETNFYRTFKRRQAKNIIEGKLHHLSVPESESSKS